MKTKILALSILVTIFATSCQKHNRNGSDGANNGTPQGTTHGGGGNGVDNKVFESYIVDPLKHEGYTKRFRPMFDRISKQYSEKLAAVEQAKGNPPSTNSSGPIAYDMFAKSKTWYIAPVDLNVIKNDVIGVVFMKNSTEQLAIQTEREVWIDSRKFEKMSLDEQSDLIAHEIMMSLYSIKFMSFKQLCGKISELLGKNECQGTEDIDEALEFEKIRPFNSDDYQNIRRVTGSIIQNRDTLDILYFVNLLNLNGYDTRIFNPKQLELPDPNNPNKAPDSIEFTPDQIANDLALVGKVAPALNLCEFAKTNTEYRCELSVERSTSKAFPTSEALAIALEWSNKSVVERYQLVSSTSSKSTSYSTEYYTVVLVPELDAPMVGNSVRFLNLTYTWDSKSVVDSAILTSVISVPAVITEITQNQNVPEYHTCKLRLKETTDEASDLIILHGKQAVSSHTKKTAARSVFPVPCK